MMTRVLWSLNWRRHGRGNLNSCCAMIQHSGKFFFGCGSSEIDDRPMDSEWGRAGALISDSVIRNDICAVIPCFNEARSIARIVEGVRGHLATVLVIDDGSSDATAREAECA